MANSSTRRTSPDVIRKIFLAMTVAALAACGGGGSHVQEGLSSTGSAPAAEEVLSASSGQGPGLVAQPPSVANSTTAGEQKASAIGALADGGYAVAWTSEDASGQKLLMQRYSAAGAKVGAETPLPLDAGHGSIAMAVQSDGGVAVAYSSTRTPSPSEPWIVSTGIYTQRFDAAGAPVGGETEVAAIVQDQTGAQTRYYVEDPAIVAWPDGSHVVGWASITEDYTGKVPQFQAQRYDNLGQAAGSPRNVGTGDVGTSFDLTTTPAGGYLVSTFRRSLGELHVRFTQVDLGHTLALPYSQDGLPADSVLLPLQQGGYVLLSQQDGSATSQRFDANGSPTGSPAALSSLPSSAWALGDGGYVLSWGSAGAERLMAQRYDSAGVALGESFQVDTGGAVPQAAPLRDGGLALAWTATLSGTDSDVATQRFEAAKLR